MLGTMLKNRAIGSLLGPCEFAIVADGEIEMGVLVVGIREAGFLVGVAWGKFVWGFEVTPFTPTIGFPLPRLPRINLTFRGVEETIIVNTNYILILMRTEHTFVTIAE